MCVCVCVCVCCVYVLCSKVRESMENFDCIEQRFYLRQRRYMSDSYSSICNLPTLLSTMILIYTLRLKTTKRLSLTIDSPLLYDNWSQLEPTCKKGTTLLQIKMEHIKLDDGSTIVGQKRASKNEKKKRRNAKIMTLRFSSPSEQVAPLKLCNRRNKIILKRFFC